MDTTEAILRDDRMTVRNGGLPSKGIANLKKGVTDPRA